MNYKKEYKKLIRTRKIKQVVFGIIGLFIIANFAMLSGGFLHESIHVFQYQEIIGIEVGEFHYNIIEILNITYFNGTMTTNTTPTGSSKTLAYVRAKRYEETYFNGIDTIDNQTAIDLNRIINEEIKENRYWMESQAYLFMYIYIAIILLVLSYAYLKFLRDFYGN